MFGTRHEREQKRVQPIVARDQRHVRAAAATSRTRSCGRQTAKFRGVLRERDRRARAPGRRAARRPSARPSDADGARAHRRGAGRRRRTRRGGRGAAAGRSPRCSTRSCPRRSPRCAKRARRLLGTTVNVTGQEIEWNMVPYDVQLMGGIELHLGRIAEMATGEGKTLVATLPLYLNALAGKGRAPGHGEHAIWRAATRSGWGTSTSISGSRSAASTTREPGHRRSAAPQYDCDITYGTNNEFGFDYLRDNMVVQLDQRVQRPHIYAIVDEVDSVLIDEARTPLIISGPGGQRERRCVREYNARGRRVWSRSADRAREPAGGRSASALLESGRHARAAALQPVQGAARARPRTSGCSRCCRSRESSSSCRGMELELHRRPQGCRPASSSIATSRTTSLRRSTRRGTRSHLTDQRRRLPVAGRSRRVRRCPTSRSEIAPRSSDDPRSRSPQEKLEARRERRASTTR